MECCLKQVCIPCMPCMMYFAKPRQLIPPQLSSGTEVSMGAQGRLGSLKGFRQIGSTRHADEHRNDLIGHSNRGGHSKLELKNTCLRWNSRSEGERHKSVCCSWPCKSPKALDTQGIRENSAGITCMVRLQYPSRLSWLQANQVLQALAFISSLGHFTES